jgi:hypothetical protein
VETQQAVIISLYTRLTGDATLEAALGAVDLYFVMAPQDPEMPYMVHRLDLNGDLFHGTNTYLLDLWDYYETPDRVNSALDRIKQLLHGWRFTTASGEAVGLVEWFSGAFIPSDGEKVWHMATQWVIRFVAAQDVTNIVG